jgi:hypothetical protein
MTEAAKYCVYNQTRESFLSLGVTAADPAPELLRGVWQQLANRADVGLWIKSMQNLDPSFDQISVDLVLLDPDYRVVDVVEAQTSLAGRLQGRVSASIVALPPHTIDSSQTQPGDQLVICEATEMESWLERISNAIFPPGASSALCSNETTQVGSVIGQSPTLNREEETLTVLQGSNAMNNLEPTMGKPNTFTTWLKNWLSSDRRRSHRQPLPGLVAYYWTGSAPRAYQIADISSTGFYLLTEERWYPGTIVLMTLQRTDSDGQNLDDSIAVQSLVVRWGSDGLGLAFVLTRSLDGDADLLRQHGADKKTLERFLSRLKQTPRELQSIHRY